MEVIGDEVQLCNLVSLFSLSLFPSHSGLSQQPGSVEQISLHCSEGALDWLYPKGALRLTLSPRLTSAAVGPGGSSSGLITACVKPSEHFHGAQLYLERDGVLELLVGDRLEESPPTRVRCFSRLPGEKVALFLQATPHQDISRRIASFRYELRGDWTARLSLDSNPVSSNEGELDQGGRQPCWISLGHGSVIWAEIDKHKINKHKSVNYKDFSQCKARKIVFEYAPL